MPAILSPNVSLLSQCIAFSKDKCEANGKIPPVILCKVCFPPLVCFDVFCLVLLFLTLHLGDVFMKACLEQRSITLNSDHIRKTALRFITFMSVYSGAASSRISGIDHPGNVKKEDTLFQMQASDLHWECFKNSCQHPSDKQRQVTQNLLSLRHSYFVAQYVLIIVVWFFCKNIFLFSSMRGRKWPQL